jgi:metal-responsive CopG/Arc/MetJ family transcriptional regulator
MRMSVSLDRQLLEDAQYLTGKKTKKEVLEEALKELIRKKRREEALKHAGKIEMDITLEDLLELRKTG